MSTERLEPAHIKQLLLYAPDDEEVKQFQHYDQDPAKLSEPDQFVLQVLFHLSSRQFYLSSIKNVNNNGFLLACLFYRCY